MKVVKIQSKVLVRADKVIKNSVKKSQFIRSITSLGRIVINENLFSCYTKALLI